MVALTVHKWCVTTRGHHGAAVVTRAAVGRRGGGILGVMFAVDVLIRPVNRRVAGTPLYMRRVYPAVALRHRAV